MRKEKVRRKQPPERVRRREGVHEDKRNRERDKRHRKEIRDAD